MGRIISNPFRGAETFPLPSAIPFPVADAAAPLALLEQCPAAAQTPLAELPGIAGALGISSLHAKDERGRMGLGSFKALGAAHVIAHAAQSVKASNPSAEWASALAGRCYVTASAGNHGLSVAAGARIFGADAVIYLAETVPEAFAMRLAAKGAQVRREGGDYEASMAAAQKAALEEGMILLSDSSWEGYTELPHRLMEGYLVLAAEMAGQMGKPPTHLFLQAGVGGLAAAVAAHARFAWGQEVVITIVEPVAAPALMASIEAGRFTPASGPVSNMGRLDCKEASLIALRGLARDADHFVTVSDEAAQAAAGRLGAAGLQTTPSGAAGYAALADATIRQAVGCGEGARAAIIISEGPEAA